MNATLLDAKLVARLNRHGRFRFCGFLCDRARLHFGVFQVRTVGWPLPRKEWIDAADWIRQNYFKKDTAAALRTAFSRGGSRIVL